MSDTENMPDEADGVQEETALIEKSDEKQSEDIKESDEVNDEIDYETDDEKREAKAQKSIYFTGLFTGMMVVVIVILLLDIFNVHLFSKSETADAVYDKAKVVEAYIKEYYWKDDTEPEKFSDYAAKGMVAALDDPYSGYLTAKEYEGEMTDVRGDYIGIGATIGYDPDDQTKKVITDLADGEPAMQAGLKVGDELVAVDGTDVREMSVDDAIAMIKGGEAKTVVLTVRRDGKKIKITVTTGKIVSVSVSGEILDSGIGYIKISEFAKQSVPQFNEAVDMVEKRNAKGLVIDVRENLGGSLSAVIEMLNRLLPKGRLITETEKGQEDKTFFSTDENHYDKPVVILINGHSASASEVFSGSMRDRGAAKLLGTKTYGKGVVQGIFPMPENVGGAIKLTTGEYRLPNGSSIDGVGIEPDIALEYEGEEADMGTEKDNQLKEAIKYLNN